MVCDAVHIAYVSTFRMNVLSPFSCYFRQSLFWRWRLAALPKHGSYTPVYTYSCEAFSLVPLRTYNFALSILNWVWIYFVGCDNFIIPLSAGCSKSVLFWRPLELEVHHVCNGLSAAVVVLRCVWNYAGAVLLNPFPDRDKWWSSV
jgi:hypothetical protein